MDDLSKYEKGYLTRNQVLSFVGITPVTFSKWIAGSSICPPAPHEKVYPDGWKSYRILVPEKEFIEWMKKNKPWMAEGRDYLNWRKYRALQKISP